MSADKPGASLLNAGFMPAGKRNYLYWRLAHLAALGLFAAGGILTVYFVQQNIFSAISNSYAVVALSASLGSDAVDGTTFEQAQKLIAAKQSVPVVPDNLRNMFEHAPVATSTPTTTPQNKKK